MKKTAQNQSGVIELIVAVLVLVVVIAVGAFILLKNSDTGKLGTSELPPESQRVNPDPASPNQISVSEVSPGTSVVAKEVKFADGGYVVIEKDTSSGRVYVGKSRLMGAGTYDNVSISTSSLVDGDVIYVVLQSADGTPLVDQNENTIEVQKNVGMVMSHYQGEY